MLRNGLKMKSSLKILHIFNNEKKFSYDFFEFLAENNFELSSHSLFQYSKKDKDYCVFDMPVIFSSLFSIWKHIKLLKLMFASEKIITHNLASPWLLLILAIFPSLNKKVYWVIWGKDLYFFKILKKKYFYHYIYEYFRKKVFKNIKQVVTHIYGDYVLAQKWYGTNANYIDSFMYPSNLFKKNTVKPAQHNRVNILIGNSADPSNNHIEILNKLLKYKKENIRIFAPLSYGNKKYAQEIIKLGNDMFGRNFKPLIDFLPSNEYFEFLESIDIAIFAHKRQQAMGNITSLIGQGKKVYMRSDISTWAFFQNIKVQLYDVSDIQLTPISLDIKSLNSKIIEQVFSKDQLVSQLKVVLE
jgi:hypothetical protein